MVKEPTRRIPRLVHVDFADLHVNIITITVCVFKYHGIIAIKLWVISVAHLVFFCNGGLFGVEH